MNYHENIWCFKIKHGDCFSRYNVLQRAAKLQHILDFTPFSAQGMTLSPG